MLVHQPPDPFMIDEQALAPQSSGHASIAITLPLLTAQLDSLTDDLFSCLTRRLLIRQTPMRVEPGSIDLQDPAELADRQRYTRLLGGFN